MFRNPKTVPLFELRIPIQILGILNHASSHTHFLEEFHDFFSLMVACPFLYKLIKLLLMLLPSTECGELWLSRPGRFSDRFAKRFPLCVGKNADGTPALFALTPV